MRINEIAIRHHWDLGSKIRDVINSNFSMDKDSLRILKSIEKEFYDNDDVIDRDRVATNRIEKELPEKFSTYILKHT